MEEVAMSNEMKAYTLITMHRDFLEVAMHGNPCVGFHLMDGTTETV